jgi:hypothetical protein
MITFMIYASVWIQLLATLYLSLHFSIPLFQSYIFVAMSFPHKPSFKIGHVLLCESHNDIIRIVSFGYSEESIVRERSKSSVSRVLVMWAGSL